MQKQRPIFLINFAYKNISAPTARGIISKVTRNFGYTTLTNKTVDLCSRIIVMSPVLYFQLCKDSRMKRRDTPEHRSIDKDSFFPTRVIYYICVPSNAITLSSTQKNAKSGLHQQDHFQRLTCAKGYCRLLLCESSKSWVTKVRNSMQQGHHLRRMSISKSYFPSDVDH